MEPKNRGIAVVTGAGDGIGRAIALRLARDGYHLAINDLDRKKAETTAEDVRKLGVQAAEFVYDVGDRKAVQEMTKKILEKFGSIDAWVNNAGIIRLGLITDLSEEDWRAIFRVNVDGVFFCCKAVVPHMLSRKKGAIVNMSSWNGKAGMPIFGAYCASKFAVIGLTQALAREVGPQGVRVNAVCPGIVAETPMRADIERQSQKFQIPPSAERATMVPLRRLAVPQDVSRVVSFLLSEDAEYMTGQAINVTGGLWMN
jgi:NAD(P)-dependent dehydrogenase (short-subunit alcohol dehydrogenase family)